MVNTQTLHNNTFIPLFMTNNSDNMIIIPIIIVTGTSEAVHCDCYSISEINLTTNKGDMTYANPVQFITAQLQKNHDKDTLVAGSLKY